MMVISSNPSDTHICMDYCPKSPDKGHKFSDYSYWGEKHPKCEWCGFVDESRLLK